MLYRHKGTKIKPTISFGRVLKSEIQNPKFTWRCRMQGWLAFWKIVFAVSVVVFFGVTIAVVILGVKDVYRLFHETLHLGTQDTEG